MSSHAISPWDPDYFTSLLAGPGSPTKGVSADSSAGVAGSNSAGGVGVLGHAATGAGVKAIGGAGVIALASQLDGVLAVAAENARNGVTAVAKNKNHSGVWADHTAGGAGVTGTSDSPGGIGIQGRGAFLAGKFLGDVDITGKLTVWGDIHLPNADLAEEFSADIEIPPGSLVTLAGDDSVMLASEEYDSRVVGVIAGAGSFRPAIVMDHRREGIRVAVTLIGKVYCKVDSSYAPIRAGDLLTSSPTPGHAMKAIDRMRAFGATIGKALADATSSRQLIPVLVTLR